METGLQYIRTTKDSYVYFPDAASYLNSGWVSSFARKPGQSPAKYRSFLPPSLQSARAFSHPASVYRAFCLHHWNAGIFYLYPSWVQELSTSIPPECKSFLPLSLQSTEAFYLYPSRGLELTTSIPLERRSFRSLSLQSAGAFYLFTFRVQEFSTSIPPNCWSFLPLQYLPKNQANK